MSRTLRWLSPLSLAVTLLATPGRAEPRKPTHVACVGDSITAGAEASSSSKSYPSQLQVLLGNGVQVRNFGNSGSTMLSAGYGDKPYIQQAEYASATDFVSKAGANAVVSVIIILGANDSKLYNWEPGGKPKNDQQYLKDYRALVEHFQGQPTKPVVYLGYPLATAGSNICCGIRGDVMENEQIPLINKLATEKRLPIIDLNKPTKGHPEYFADGVHPNDAGYLVLANLVKDGLAREPRVTLTSPMAGATFGFGASVALMAEAGDSTVDVSSVEFFEGTTSLGKVTAKPFTFNWAAPAGMHTVTAKATDTTLATATSEAVTFTTRASGAGGNGTGGSSGGTGGTSAAAGGGAGGATAGGAGGANAGAAGGANAGPGGAGAGGTMPVPSAGAPASAGNAPVTAAPVAADSGCGVAAPAAPGTRSLALLVLASLLGLPRLRRRLKPSRA